MLITFRVKGLKGHVTRESRSFPFKLIIVDLVTV